MHASTSFAPNEVIFGKILESSIDRKLEAGNDTLLETGRVLNAATKKIEDAQIHQKNSYNRNAKSLDNFNVEDEIMLINTRQVKDVLSRNTVHGFKKD